MKKFLVVLLTLMLILTLSVGCSGSGTEAEPASGNSGEGGDSSEPMTLRVGHAGFEIQPQHLGWLKFEEYVESESGGAIQIEIFPNAQLGNDRELCELVQLGELDFTSISSSPLAPFDPEFYVLDIPFMFSDREKTYEILDGEAGQLLMGSLENAGLKGLGYMENGFRQLSNSVREIRTPEDIAGLKIRTMNNDIHMKFWELCGANPTPMAFGELYTALKQKVVNGQENPYTNIAQGKLHECQPYISETNHLYTPFVTFTNLDFWNSLTEEQQKIIQEGIDLAVAESREQGEKVDAEARELIEDYGCEISILTEDEIQQFKDKMSPILEDIGAKTSPEIMDTFMEATNY